jgi:hypothetical protein
VAAQSPADRGAAEGRDPIGRALHATYDADYAGSRGILDAHLAANPTDALGYGARAAVLVFEEYQRLQILELDFFGNDDDVTGKLRVKPDPAVRAQVMEAIAQARRLAGNALAADPADRRALTGLGIAAGVEMQYAAIVEKRYIRTGTLSRECQALADRSLALSPAIYDAYVVLGSIEYVVASLNPFYRFVARLFGLRADKALAIDHLQIVAARGQYFGPFAKMLLAVVSVRDGKLPEARALVGELHDAFPNNPLYAKEAAKLDARISGR